MHLVLLFEILRLFVIAHQLFFLSNVAVDTLLCACIWIWRLYKSHQHMDSHQFQDAGTGFCCWFLGWRESPMVDSSEGLLLVDYGSLTGLIQIRQNFQSKRKFLMKLGNLLCSLKLSRSFIISYFLVVSYTFSKLKKLLWVFGGIFASLIEVSNLTTWSIVDLWLLKLYRELVIRLLEPINQINHL